VFLGRPRDATVKAITLSRWEVAAAGPTSIVIEFSALPAGRVEIDLRAETVEWRSAMIEKVAAVCCPR
jgi:hypothetical protein